MRPIASIHLTYAELVNDEQEIAGARQVCVSEASDIDREPMLDQSHRLLEMLHFVFSFKPTGKAAINRVANT
jgi:hypothetical protein